MVAGRDDRRAGAEQFDALLAADTASARRILAIDDGEIGGQFPLQSFEPLVQRVAPGLAHHIAQKKYPDHFEQMIQPRISPMSLMETAVRPSLVPEPAPWRVCAGSNCRVFRPVDRDVPIAISPTKNRAETARSTCASAHGRITLRVIGEAAVESE